MLESPKDIWNWKLQGNQTLAKIKKLSKKDDDKKIEARA